MREIARKLMDCAEALMNLASQLGNENNVIDALDTPKKLEHFIQTFEQSKRRLDVAMSAIQMEAIEKHILLTIKGNENANTKKGEAETN